MDTIALPKKQGHEKGLSQRPGNQSLLNFLLYCGILSSIWYVVMNIYVPRFFPGYNSVSMVVSELSAIDAPSSRIWNLLGILYTVLVTAFGFGVWKSAGQNRSLKIAGGLLIAYGALGIFWPLAPMHLRETLAAGGGTWSDTMHIVLSALTQLIYLLALGFAAASLGKGFRFYSILTFLVLVVFGTLTFLESPGLSSNQPTPRIGLWERINIGVFLVWIIVLSWRLLTASRKQENKKKI